MARRTRTLIRDAEILVRGTPGEQKGEPGIGDISTGYYTLLFLFENNKKLKMTSRSDPLAAYADYREQFRESLAAVKAMPRVRERLDAMPDYMSNDGFHEADRFVSDTNWPMSQTSTS